MNAGGGVWFQQVSVGLSEWGTREWTFSSLLLVRAQGKMGEFRLFWPRSEGENVVIGSPRRPASVGAKCAQFAAAGSFHTATYTMYNRCASLLLLLCLQGGWSGADFRPVACEQEGGDGKRLRDWMTCWVIHCWTALTAVLQKLPSRNLSALKYTSWSPAG